MVAEATALEAGLVLGPAPQALTSLHLGLQAGPTFPTSATWESQAQGCAGLARPGQGTLPRRPPDVGWEHVRRTGRPICQGVIRGSDASLVLGRKVLLKAPTPALGRVLTAQPSSSSAGAAVCPGSV